MTFEREAVTGMEQAYLEHILLYVRSGDQDKTLLSTLMNSWFAYHCGGVFLNNGKPRWLSRSGDKKILAEHVHARSKAATRALEEGRIDDIVIDHTIPSKEIGLALRDRHLREPFRDARQLRDFLTLRFTLTLLTHEEHNEHVKPYRSTMPECWAKGDLAADPELRYCRYLHCNRPIEFEILKAHATA